MTKEEKRVSRKTGLRRLLKLAKFLREEVPRKSFDMGSWTHGCGTAACALGWATTIPGFRRAGLFMATDIPSPGYGHARGFRAGLEFFGLRFGEAETLFNPYVYEANTPKAVAKRIEAFVKRAQREAA